MKKRLLLFMFLLGSLCSYSQDLNAVACKKFEDSLHIISAFLNDINSDPSLKRIDAINFLEQLTKIRTTSMISFAGPEFPKKKDYDKWLSWYNQNHARLSYNVRNDSITLVIADKR